jgi:hypothetical protein
MPRGAILFGGSGEVWRARDRVRETKPESIQPGNAGGRLGNPHGGRNEILDDRCVAPGAWCAAMVRSIS